MIDKDMDNSTHQGGSIRPRNTFRGNVMEPRSPHTPWQIGTSQEVSQPMEQDDRNDSGLASGSDHSTSPSSDSQLRFYSAAVFGINPYAHPLTPPNSEPLVSPKSEKDEDTTLTPGASPEQSGEDGDHLRRLQMSLERNLQFSPGVSENSMDENARSDNDPELDESLRIPKINSHGKVKTFKCKQCDHVSKTKVEQWQHSSVHIRADKRLECPKCPFVTEYKHHLEYHLRNHAGSKPFKCKECEYTCVNKSMLNSHMKSHSSVYRFRCENCAYATKYCHSLKLHLRRYGHSPSVVLDEHGKPSPDHIIDVYGTRRGPKVKSCNQQRDESSQRPEPPHPYNFPTLPGYPYFAGFPDPLLQLMRHQAIAAGIPSPESLEAVQERLLQQLMQRQSLPAAAAAAEPEPQPEPEPEDSVLDLSKPGGSGTEKKNKRKGPAFKMEVPAVESEEEEDDEETTTMFSNVEAVVKKEETPAEVTIPDTNNNKSENTCEYCNISFGDEILYRLHMAYHGFKDPFTCNMCGEKCPNKIEFYLHIARVSH